MAALDFPASPTLNQIYTANGKSWIWDGTAWNPYGGGISTLPIANGGTGQTTQTAAFDALAPTTTKGDIIVHNGSDNIRVAVGTDGHSLVADSTQASGVKWAAGGGGGGKVAQVAYTQNATQKTSTVTVPFDDTIPQSTEGTEYAELDTTITPTNASSRLLIELQLTSSSTSSAGLVTLLFRDAETDALASNNTSIGGAGFYAQGVIRCIVSAGSTSAQTFKCRFGRSGGAATIYLNDYTTALYGGTIFSSMTITEILP